MREFRRKLKGLGFYPKEDDYFIFIENNNTPYIMLTKSTKEITLFKCFGKLDEKFTLLEIVTEYFYDELVGNVDE